ncbi:MAG: apolipoprotein N-acyltransferase [Chlamydiia bacterium]|nr:apolipoprotein N-acyltransferase [Chlamydiia bacterium]
MLSTLDIRRVLLLIASGVIVALGQPSLSEVSSLLTYCFGIALFGAVCLEIPSARQRFFLGTVWMAAIQLYQLNWAVTHPYSYIYIPYFGVSLIFGLQFGVLAGLLTRERVANPRFPLAGAGLWTLFEWSRQYLFVVLAMPWNSLGLPLVATVASQQLAGVGGIYLLVFWCLLVNLLALRWWVVRGAVAGGIYALALFFPFLYGWTALALDGEGYDGGEFRALIVQTATPIEELIPFQRPADSFAFALEEWRSMLQLMAPFRGRAIDLILFPENTVSHGAYWAIYSLDSVKEVVASVFGEEAVAKMPDPMRGGAIAVEGGEGSKKGEGKEWRVCNAYLAQTAANLFDSEVVIGLEDVERMEDGDLAAFASAFHFLPNSPYACRYDKQILVPFAEGLPFEWCKVLAKGYGVCGGMTPGSRAVVSGGGRVPLGFSICFEEMCGEVMRANRSEGAQLLLNLTNDGWYPNSRLPLQHLDLARLRAVELGMPQLRASSSGASSAIAATGELLALAEPKAPNYAAEPVALEVAVPLQMRWAPYSRWGDLPVLGASCMGLLAFVFSSRRRRG